MVCGLGGVGGVGCCAVGDRRDADGCDGCCGAVQVAGSGPGVTYCHAAQTVGFGVGARRMVVACGIRFDDNASSDLFVMDLRGSTGETARAMESSLSLCCRCRLLDPQSACTVDVLCIDRSRRCDRAV